MGGCVSIQISCDQLINNVCNCLSRNRGYVHGLDHNLAALQRDVEEIEQRRGDLLRKIVSAEKRGLQRLDFVQGWVSKVEEIVPRANELLKMRSVQVRRLCLCGYCSKNLVSNYRYGKRVKKMVKAIEVLRSQGYFEVVAERALVTRVEERPTRPMVAMESMLESTWNRLMEDEIGILGLHGMGGVGKTTLLSHINNRFSRVGNDYDIVIWVVVSKDLQIHRIQDEIWEKLQCDNEEWKQRTEDRKASDIFNVLKQQKFVLLLDDIWSKVDLTKIGVPFPSRENGCKVVFTTRLKEICGRMGVDCDVEVRCLAPDNAWDLFAKKVGETTLESHPDIPLLARTVAKKCHGLPLALNVIGETMAYKRTLQEWRLAIDVLTSSASEFSGMEDEILPILKYSYDNLKSEQLKLCFQYCALFPEDYNIEKEDLVDYWIGEGFIDGNKGRAENQGYEIIGSLVRSCMLMEENQETVKMHDVVREMALWIASDFGERKENFMALAGFQLKKIPEIKKWKATRRVSLMFNRIETILETPECPQLITLFLQNNNWLNYISGEFFRFMPTLVVLDLSRNSKLSHLPKQISECVSLQYLSLSRTGIKVLPVGFLELKKLIYLNLEYTRVVECISGISGLWNLKVLRLFVSGFKEDLCVVEELQVLENLQTLTINLSLAYVLKKFLSSQRLASCTRVLRIENLDPQSSEISFVTSMDNLRELYLEHSDISEIKIEVEVLPLDSLSTPFFPNLTRVSLEFCKGLRDLSWLLFAPNLTILRVMSANQLEEIISKEKAEQQSLIPFQKLKELHLENAKMLKYIHWSPLPFPYLQKVLVKECSELRRLPLESTSVPKGDLVIEAPEPWIHCLEWEDEAAENRFMPSIKAFPLWSINIDGL